MIKHGIFLLVGVLFGLQCMAQQVTMSDPQKLSSKTPNLRILGKSDQGVVIYKFGKGVDIVEAYGENLEPRWTQTLSIKQESSSIKDIYLFPTYSVAYFTAVEKDATVLYAQILDSKFKSGGKFLVADTINGSKYEVETRLRTVTSQNQEHLLTYYPQYTANKLGYVQLVGLNDKLDVLYKRKLNFPALADNHVLAAVYPANNGSAYLLFEDVDRTRRRYSGDQEFVLYRFDANAGVLEPLPIALEQPVYGALKVSVDNINNRITLGGMYSGDNREEATGYFFKSFDMANGQVQGNIYRNFSQELLFQVVGKDTSQNISGLQSFKVSDYVMRRDGGVLLIAESRYDNIEAAQSPGFAPTAGPNFRTVNVYYYNDILVVSIKPDGSQDWFNVLRKKQVSEDDEGFFSGFCLLRDNNRLRFIYNEEIYYKTNVNEFAVDTVGIASRSHVFNAGLRDIMLAPTLGKQIAANELIIPSFRNRAIRFVKLTY